MSDQAVNITIIKKKKIIAGGHHGGAWKVAYADFVTAMMSLFIVLWLLSSSNDQVKKSVAGYFNDPRGTGTLEGSSQPGVGHALPITRADMATLKERLLQSAQQLPNFEKLRKQVEISASPDGLRIELMEDEGGTFFESGSAVPTPALREFLTLISKELGKMPNRISIEGHTDSHPYSNTGGYSNWELSADRANAARRLMQTSGVGAGQIAQVRGFADQMPRKPDRPEDSSNRRITVIVDAAPVVETAPVQVAEGEQKPGGDAKPAAEGKPAADGKPGAEGKPGADAKAVPAPAATTATAAAARPAAKEGSAAGSKPPADAKVVVATESSPLRALAASKSFMTNLMARVRPGAGKAAPAATEVKAVKEAKDASDGKEIKEVKE